MISVIVPVYNTAAYLDECIQSVVSQTYQDLEILLIDDCSTDGSSQKLDQWGAKDERIRVVHKEKNSGVSASRNIGLKMARGEYIAFVDSDDYIDRTMYEKMLTNIVNTGADVAICGMKSFGNGPETMLFVNNSTGCTLPSDKTIECCLPKMGQNRHGNTYSVTKLYSKNTTYDSVKDELIMFNENIRFSEDSLWVINVLVNCKLAVFVDECLYIRRAGRSGNSKIIIEKGALDPVYAWENIYTILQNKGYSAAPNAFQRIMKYKCLGLKAATKSLDVKLYHKCADGFLKALLDWHKANASHTDIDWEIRQLLKYLYYCIGMKVALAEQQRK